MRLPVVRGAAMRLRRSIIAAFVALAAGIVAPAHGSVPWVGFEDVSPANIFYDDIAWLRDQGITKGCNPPANTMYCPKRAVTRGEMAAFLSRALDLPPVGAGDWFTDDATSIYQDDINRIAAAGITMGCNPPANTWFCPTQPVTRQQMASFLVRGMSLDVGAGLDWFTDDDDSVHESNIDRLRTSWVTFGCNPPTENHFCPTTPVTREQMAAFLHRALVQPVEGAAIATHGSTWPETLYAYVDMVATFGVRNAGTEPLHDVTAAPYRPDPTESPLGDCTEADLNGPTELIGNADDILDPGEVWDWYCAYAGYGDWGAMYIQARALPPTGSEVTAVGHLEYSFVDPLDMVVVVSQDQVAPGGTATWTVTLTNPSGIEAVSVLIEVRENGLGSYTQYRSPGAEVVGDGDDVFELGEIWQYTYAGAIWVDTYLEVAGSYAPAWSPGSHTGLAYLYSDTVTIVPE